MGKRFAFDIGAAIKAAWVLCWADNLKQRAKNDDALRNKSLTYQPLNSATYYLTASDLVNQVRQFADETSRGEKWGKTGRAWGRPYTMVRLSGDVQGRVRDWLSYEVRMGRLASHNFGRGHISGMRFRPAGEPISEAEQSTFKAKAERAAKREAGIEPPKHFRKGGGAACTAKRRSMYSRPNYSMRYRCTTDTASVTCKRCQNLLAAEKKRAA